ncbi:MAG TPA: type II secretion system F family protein [Pirellulales bacterium]|jgi:tight adherence protein B|nr:type II secretion system F family protein [Pirellulales bacterium]
MGEQAIVLVGLAGGCGALAYAWQQLRLREISRARMESARQAEADAAAPVIDVEARFARRHYLLPWLVGVLLAAALHWLTGLSLLFSCTLGAMVGFLSGLADAMWLERRELKIEQQLADAIDLMVGALFAGASVPGALESAWRESRQPLRPQLEEMLGRLRYGDQPLAVFSALTRRVPLENFRLFSAALAVHWEVGGSLAPTLSTVGRTIRDRIDIGRRIRSMTTQSRVSTLAVLAATYFIGLIMWRNAPDKFEAFLQNPIGQSAVAAALILQAVGVVWASKIGKVKF